MSSIVDVPPSKWIQMHPTYSDKINQAIKQADIAIKSAKAILRKYHGRRTQTNVESVNESEKMALVRKSVLTMMSTLQQLRVDVVPLLSTKDIRQKVAKPTWTADDYESIMAFNSVWRLSDQVNMIEKALEASDYNSLLRHITYLNLLMSKIRAYWFRETETQARTEGEGDENDTKSLSCEALVQQWESDPSTQPCLTWLSTSTIARDACSEKLQSSVHALMVRMEQSLHGIPMYRQPGYEYYVNTLKTLLLLDNYHLQSAVDNSDLRLSTLKEALREQMVALRSGQHTSTRAFLKSFHSYFDDIKDMDSMWVLEGAERIYAEWDLAWNNAFAGNQEACKQNHDISVQYVQRMAAYLRTSQNVPNESMKSDAAYWLKKIERVLQENVLKDDDRAHFTHNERIRKHMKSMFVMMHTWKLQRSVRSHTPELTPTEQLQVTLVFLAEYLKFSYQKVNRLMSFDHLWLNEMDMKKHANNTVMGLVFGWANDFALEIFTAVKYLARMLYRRYAADEFKEMITRVISFRDQLKLMLFQPKLTATMALSWASKHRVELLKEVNVVFKQAMHLYKSWNKNDIDVQLPMLYDPVYTEAEIHILLSKVSEAVYAFRHPSASSSNTPRSIERIDDQVERTHTLYKQIFTSVQEFKTIHSNFTTEDAHPCNALIRTYEQILTIFIQRIQTETQRMISWKKIPSLDRKESLLQQVHTALDHMANFTVLGFLELSAFGMARHHSTLTQLSTYGHGDQDATDWSRFSDVVNLCDHMPIWVYRYKLRSLMEHAKHARFHDFVSTNMNEITPRVRQTIVDHQFRLLAWDEPSHMAYHEFLRVIKDKLNELHQRFGYHRLMAAWYHLDVLLPIVQWIPNLRKNQEACRHIMQLGIPLDSMDTLTEWASSLRRADVDLSMIDALRVYLTKIWDAHWSLGPMFELFVYFYDKTLYFDFLRFQELYTTMVEMPKSLYQMISKAMQHTNVKNTRKQPWNLLMKTSSSSPSLYAPSQLATAGSSDAALLFDLKDFTTNESLMKSMRVDIDVEARRFWQAYTVLREKKKLAGFFNRHFGAPLQTHYKQTIKMINEAQLHIERLMDMSFGDMNKEWMVELTSFYFHCQSLNATVKSVWDARDDRDLSHSLAELDILTSQQARALSSSAQVATKGDEPDENKKTMIVNPSEKGLQRFIDFLSGDTAIADMYLEYKERDLYAMFQCNENQAAYIFHALYGVKPTEKQQEQVMKVLCDSQTELEEREIPLDYQSHSFLVLSSVADSVLDSIQYCRVAYLMNLGVPLRRDHVANLKKLSLLLEEKFDDDLPTHPWVEFIFEMHDTISEASLRGTPVIEPLDVTELEDKEGMTTQFNTYVHTASPSVHVASEVVRDRAYAIQVAAECIYLRRSMTDGKHAINILYRLINLMAQWKRGWFTFRVPSDDAQIHTLSDHTLAMHEIHMSLCLLNQYLDTLGFVDKKQFQHTFAMSLRVASRWESIVLLTTFVESVVDTLCAHFDVTGHVVTSVETKQNSPSPPMVVLHLPTYNEPVLTAILSDALWVPLTTRLTLPMKSHYLQRVDQQDPSLAKQRPIDLLLTCLQL